jgi:hypothetical protein
MIYLLLLKENDENLRTTNSTPLIDSENTQRYYWYQANTKLKVWICVFRFGEIQWG